MTESATQPDFRDEFVDFLVDHQYKENPLETVQQFSERKRLELEADLEGYKEALNEGAELFLSSRRSKAVQKTFAKIGNYKLDGTTTDKSLGERMGITDDEFQALYDLASEKIEGRRFDESAKMFLVLSVLNPTSYAVWMGMGLAETMRQEYEDADICYRMAIIWGEDQPMVYMYAADCRRRANQLEEAIQYLEQAVAVSEKRKAEGIKKQAISQLKELKAA